MNKRNTYTHSHVEINGMEPGDTNVYVYVYYIYHTNIYYYYHKIGIRSTFRKLFPIGNNSCIEHIDIALFNNNNDNNNIYRYKYISRIKREREREGAAVFGAVVFISE